MGYKKGSHKPSKMIIIGLNTPISYDIPCSKCGTICKHDCYDTGFVCDACKEQVQVVSRRATCKGIQYTVADTLSTHTVTVNAGLIGCSCGLDKYFLVCEHIRIVEKQEAVYAEEANKRASYEATFDVSYGC